MTVPVVRVDTGMDTVPDPTGRARADSRDRGLEVEICERPQSRSLDEAAVKLGLEPHGIVKSLVVRRAADDHVFVLLPADRSLSWPLLRKVAGANRMTLPDADEARAATGYERGTISPIGSSSPWPVFIDASVANRIAIGCGSHRHSVLLDTNEFVAAYGATVATLTE